MIDSPHAAGSMAPITHSGSDSDPDGSRRREGLLLLRFTPAAFSGADVKDTEEDCQSEATSPAPSEPAGETSSVEPEEGSSAQAEDSRPAEETSPADPPADPAQPKDHRDSNAPESGRDSSSQSVDELLADWQEDLEAFKQMEKDEL